MNNNQGLTWLHISDIHFGHGGTRYRVDQKIICDEILRDAGEMVERLGPPDLVLVTGDIAFRADPDKEYPQAAAWLKDLLRIIGVEQDQLYLVPGNHDVDRSKANANFTCKTLHQRLRANPADLDELLDQPVELAQIWRKLEAYAGFAQSYAAPHLTSEQPFWICGRNTALGKVIIVGLNTTLLSFDDEDGSSNLALGKKQLQEAIYAQPRDALLLVLQHHPPSWLKDSSKLRSMLQDRAHILFCGHIHDQGGLLSAPLHGGEWLELMAGAGHADPTYLPEHAYAWGRLNPSGLAYFPRTWNERQHRFRPDRNSFRDVRPDDAVFFDRERLPKAMRDWLPPPKINDGGPPWELFSQNLYQIIRSLYQKCQMQGILVTRSHLFCALMPYELQRYEESIQWRLQELLKDFDKKLQDNRFKSSGYKPTKGVTETWHMIRGTVQREELKEIEAVHVLLELMKEPGNNIDEGLRCYGLTREDIKNGLHGIVNSPEIPWISNARPGL